MKKFLHLFIFFVAIAVFVSCNTKTPAVGAAGVTADTTGFSEFQMWKASRLSSEAPAYQQASNNATQKRPVTKIIKTYVPAESSVSMNSTGEYAAKPDVKKGWSRKAKGAVIGGGGGAIIGALL